MSFIRYSALFLFFLATAAAANGTLSGKVDMDGRPVDRLVVEIGSTVRQGSGQRVMTGPDGSFEIRDLAPGEYVIRVTDLHGIPLHERFFTMSMGGDSVTLRVPPPPGSRPLTGTVNAKALAVKIPSKAKKLFKEAAKVSARGDHARSAALLNEGLAIAPGVAGAWSNLGVQQLYLNDTAAAERSFAKALELGGGHAMVHTNHAYALARLNRAGEAAEEARRAVRLDPSYLRGHYMLGVILLPDPRHSDEAARHLEAAQDAVPRAHVQLAELYARRGDRKAAERELREYLETGATEMRPQVEQWMSRMKAK